MTHEIAIADGVRKGVIGSLNDAKYSVPGHPTKPSSSEITERVLGMASAAEMPKATNNPGSVTITKKSGNFSFGKIEPLQDVKVQQYKQKEAEIENIDLLRYGSEHFYN